MTQNEPFFRRFLKKKTNPPSELKSGSINYSQSIINASASFVASSPKEIVNSNFPIDTFICYNTADKLLVTQLVIKLREKSINYWIDTEQIPCGRPPASQVQNALNQCRTGSVFIGTSGIGQFQQREIGVFYQRPQKDLPVIVLLLPGQDAIPPDEPFLNNYGLPIIVDINSNLWVNQWLFGITGNRVFIN